MVAGGLGGQEIFRRASGIAPMLKRPTCMHVYVYIWEFPKIRSTFLGGSIIF